MNSQGGHLRCRNGRQVSSWVALSLKGRVRPCAPGLEPGAAAPRSSSSKTATTFQRQQAADSQHSVNTRCAHLYKKQTHIAAHSLYPR